MTPILAGTGAALMSLAVALSGAAAADAQGADSTMRRRCTGEAAGMYGVQVRQIRLGAMVTRAGGFMLDGTVDKGAEGIKKMRCLFRQDRTLDHIMAMTPDGE